MDDSRIWFYAVLVYFAFVSWLRKRIKTVSEARRARAESQGSDRSIERKRQQPEQREIQSQTRPEQPQEAKKPPGSLKELFQQVAEEQAKAQRAAQQAKTPPPPLPKPVVSRDEEFHQQEGAFRQQEGSFHQQDEAFNQKNEAFHQTEGAFHQTHQASTVHSSLRVKKHRPRKRTAELRSDRTRLALAEAFSDRGKLRNAVILKEILDTPKSLR